MEALTCPSAPASPSVRNADKQNCAACTLIPCWPFGLRRAPGAGLSGRPDGVAELSNTSISDYQKEPGRAHIGRTERTPPRWRAEQNDGMPSALLRSLCAPAKGSPALEAGRCDVCSPRTVDRLRSGLVRPHRRRSFVPTAWVSIARYPCIGSSVRGLLADENGRNAVLTGLFHLSSDETLAVIR